MRDPELGEGGGDARKGSIGTSDKSGIYIAVFVFFFLNIGSMLNFLHLIVLLLHNRLSLF